MKLRKFVKEIYTWDEDGDYVVLHNESTIQYRNWFGRWTDIEQERDRTLVDDSQFTFKKKGKK